MSVDSGRESGTVVQSFGDELDAEAAVRALHDAGFGNEDISIVVHDGGRAERVDDDPDVEVEGRRISIYTGDWLREQDKLAEGAAGLIVQGIGFVIGAPLATRFAGTDRGDLAAVIAKLGVPMDQARGYQQSYQAGGTLVVVVAGAREQEARQILGEGYKAYQDSLNPIEPEDVTSAAHPSGSQRGED